MQRISPGPVGDQSGRCGVACSQGVRDGLSVDGVAPAPKYIPVAPNGPGPIVLWISMPYLHFSASNNKSKQPEKGNVLIYIYMLLYFIPNITK